MFCEPKVLQYEHNLNIFMQVVVALVASVCGYWFKLLHPTSPLILTDLNISCVNMTALLSGNAVAVIEINYENSVIIKYIVLN